MKKLYILIRVVLVMLIILNILVFYKAKKIEESNKLLEKKIDQYLDLKEKIEVYNNLLENANILEKTAQELEIEKEIVDKQIIDLTLEINNIQENIKKLK